MQNIYKKLGLLASCAIVIIASGEATGPGTYELYSSTAEATSVLSGSALQASNSTGNLVILPVAGSLTHNTGNLTVDDGDYSLTDPDGPDAQNILTDGSSNLTYNDNFSGTYSSVISYQQNYQVSGTGYDVTGLIGIATKNADIPDSGSTTYTGEATAVVVTNSSGFDLESGTSEVAANFGTGTANVTLNGFTSYSQATGLVAPAPIDEIKITNMTINGNGFTNGTATTLNSGSVVDIIGLNNNQTSIGNFFGLNEAGTGPAEVGGHVLMQGDSGIVTGTYLAK